MPFLASYSTFAASSSVLCSRKRARLKLLSVCRVWLPKAIVMKGDLQVAIGSFDVDYRREFLEYRKAETAARIRYGDAK